MRAGLRSLGVHLGVGFALALVLAAVCALFGLHLSLPTLCALGLAGGAGLWLVRAEVSRADTLDPPPLDLDVDYALPHGQDMRVRRLEDVIHGAQPHRRMTSRALARTLGEVAEARSRDPLAPPLSPALSRLLEQVRDPGTEAESFPPIDRRTLHRHLRELSDTTE